MAKGIRFGLRLGLRVSGLGLGRLRISGLWFRVSVLALGLGQIRNFGLLRCNLGAVGLDKQNRMGVYPSKQEPEE